MVQSGAGFRLCLLNAYVISPIQLFDPSPSSHSVSARRPAPGREAISDMSSQSQSRATRTNTLNQPNHSRLNGTIRFQVSSISPNHAQATLPQGQSEPPPVERSPTRQSRAEPSLGEQQPRFGINTFDTSHSTQPPNLTANSTKKRSTKSEAVASLAKGKSKADSLGQSRTRLETNNQTSSGG